MTSTIAELMEKYITIRNIQGIIEDILQNDCVEGHRKDAYRHNTYQSSGADLKLFVS